MGVLTGQVKVVYLNHAYETGRDSSGGTIGSLCQMPIAGF
jgi:hypothetical protein